MLNNTHDKETQKENMKNFQDHHLNFDRKFSIASKLLIVWFLFVAAIAATTAGLAIYVLFHPELIGQYIGAVVGGFSK